MLFYPVELTPDDNDTFLVTFPLLPEVTTFGADPAEAMRNAQDAFEEALAARLAHWKAVPIADDLQAGMLGVMVPSASSIKVLLLWFAVSTKCRALSWPGGLHGIANKSTGYSAMTIIRASTSSTQHLRRPVPPVKKRTSAQHKREACSLTVPIPLISTCAAIPAQFQFLPRTLDIKYDIHQSTNFRHHAY